MPEIIIKNATKRFGNVVAIENLDITIEDKGFVTLLGPSGCGKTTTLRMISGLGNPTDGDIYIDGNLVFSASKGIDLPPAKRDVGFLVSKLRIVASHDG
jgi:ABC-type sugar transport system ATPase subunit